MQSEPTADARRESGILLHLTSLPGPWGIGDLGDDARWFVDWLARAGQGSWQMLPVGPTGYGDSPYALLSLFGGNPLLVSLDRLAADGLLSGSDALPPPDLGAADRVEFGAVIPLKRARLERAATTFFRDAPHQERTRFEEFLEAQQWWLDDCCRFLALKDQNGGRSWDQWDQHAPDPRLVDLHRLIQYWFHQQWHDLRAYAHARHVRLIGDVPIYPAYDSADVWAHPEYYQVDAHGRPTAVAGVPPDYFSPTGQRWGNPLYDWERMRADGFQWWIGRLRYLGALFDVLRLDHFRGFAAYWRVPAGQPTAAHGEWVSAPGRALFETLIRTGAIQGPAGGAGVRCIAEDLGLITPDVTELRQAFGFPGMRVLQFAFDGSPANPHLPHHYEPNLVAYTATHDNDTMLGWYSRLDRPTRDLVHWYVGEEPTSWSFIRYVAGSVACLAVFPLQDVLGLGSEARMNAPGRAADNWRWRFRREALTDEIGATLRLITERYDRLPPRPPGSGS
jgi:4-alpha-glucanotransferase